MRHVGEPLQRRRLIRYLDIDDVCELDVGAFAGVVRAAKHGVPDEPFFTNAEFRKPGADGRFERAVWMIEGKFDFA